MSTKIDWCDETLNPMGWGCYGPGGTKEKPRICSYCYARDWARNTPYKVKCQKCLDFEPHYHPERLKGFTGKKSKKIFIQSMGDLFGDWVEKEFIQDVINFCKQRPQHTFMFLTKNPARYAEFDFPENCWLGVTKTTGKDADGLSMVNMNKSFLSIEPLLGSFEDLSFYGFDQIIVGAMTGPNAVIPKKEWIDSIKHPNIYFKENIRRYL